MKAECLYIHYTNNNNTCLRDIISHALATYAFCDAGFCALYNM